MINFDGQENDSVESEMIFVLDSQQATELQSDNIIIRYNIEPNVILK